MWKLKACKYFFCTAAVLSYIMPDMFFCILMSVCLLQTAPQTWITIPRRTMIATRQSRKPVTTRLTDRSVNRNFLNEDVETNIGALCNLLMHLIFNQQQCYTLSISGSLR